LYVNEYIFKYLNLSILGNKTNVFKPQENNYLNSGPGLDLVLTFLNEIKKLKKINENVNENENPEIKYLQVSFDFMDVCIYIQSYMFVYMYIRKCSWIN
jgi:hypothetical protein